MHSQWIEKLLDGTTVTIRPIGADDAVRERAFIAQNPQGRSHSSGAFT